MLVIHENRGLNPYIEDVARRAAVAGFVALAPDGLFPVGGYPGNDDDGRTLQKSLDQTKLRQDMLNSATYLKSHPLSSGKLGATGFCWGGGTTNFLATTLGSDLQAGVPFYGASPKAEDVGNIKAPMLIHLAENDDRINAMWPDYEQALKANGVTYQQYTYPGTRHGFHNNSTPRYNEAVAWLDDDEHVQLVTQAAAELAVAEASLAEVKSALIIPTRELNRISTLRKRGVASASQFDVAQADQLTKEAQTKVASDQVTKAQAALASAKVRLGYTQVVASWNGGQDHRVVAERFIDEGETVSANAPLLSIVELHPIKGVIFVACLSECQADRRQEFVASGDVPGH